MEFITQKEIDFFHANGYLVLEGVIEPERCDYFLNLFIEHAEKIGNHDFKEMLQIHRELPEVLELMKDKKAVAAIEGILDGEAVGLQTVCTFKKAGTPSAKHAWNPHQDGTYMNVEHNKEEYNDGSEVEDKEVSGYVSGNVVLDDHLPSSGVLYVYPGSHVEELLPYERKTSFNKGGLEENPGNKVLNVPQKYKKANLYPKKGSFIVFHGNLIHGSYENTSKNLSRPVLLQSYTKKGVEFYAGQTAKRIPISLK